MGDKKKKKKIKSRLPLPQKPGHPIGTPKGEKGYDRKREKKEIDFEKDNS